MDMKKILQAIDGAAAKPQAQVGDMKRFVSIIAEGTGKLNKLTAAESIAVNHFVEEQTKTVTNPVLNVAKDAKLSMIGKYFKTVENEFAESTERTKSRATQLAERVIERVVGGQEPEPGINRLTGKPVEPAAPAAPAPAGPTLSSRYGPGYEGSPAAYTIKVDGQDYKFAGRDKSGPGTGKIIKVPGGAVGIRGLAPVSVEIGQDGMFYIAPKTESTDVTESPFRRSSYYNPMDQERDQQRQMDYEKRDFKRREMEHELGHEDDPDFERKLRQQQMDKDRGPWYLKVNGKILKSKGEVKVFDWKKGANNYALAILKNKPELQGKIFLTKRNEDTE
jgi:hypothetical protein